MKLSESLNSAHENSGNAASAARKAWKSPLAANQDSDRPDGLRLRLERNQDSLPQSARGRSVNRFLLREEKQEAVECTETLRAKRLQFKALFEAGAN